MARVRVVALVAAVALTAAGCDWAQAGFGPSHQSFNGGDATFTTDNVSQLELRWSTNASAGSLIAWGDNVAVTADAVGGNRVVVYAADGSGCSGTPVTCTPRWTSSVGRYAGIAVDGSTLFATVMTDPTHAQLAAFDAAGAQGCSGTPTTCLPRWTATWPTITPSVGSPVIAGGRVYVAANGSNQVFDAVGTAGCSVITATCAPLFALSGAAGTVSVRSGLAFSATATDVAVFDATGATCGSVCTPIRRLATGPSPRLPALAHGFVYVLTADGLAVFDEQPTPACPGVPATCAPRWTTPVTGYAASLAVTDSTVLVSFTGGLWAFDAFGQVGCSGTPTTCTTIWEADTPGLSLSSPLLATASIVFLEAFTLPYQDSSIAAFDVDGDVGCSGTPKRCRPLWERPSTGGTAVAGLIAAHGRLIFTFRDFGLLVYDLPA